MRARGLLVPAGIAVLAVALVVAIRNSGPATAFQGSDCASFRLPEGAAVYQVGTSTDKKTNIMDYKTPDGNQGQLRVPYDLQPATCVDEQIRGIVTIVHEDDQKMKDSMCRFIGDLLSGRVKLPPDKGDHFDRVFAQEWYRTSCPGGR